MSKDVTRRTGREAARSTGGDVANFLDRLAQTPNLKAAGGRGRLVFAMDATASREPTWDRACHIQAEMFRETEVLGGLEVQLVFYRGFGECKASPWVDSSGDLVRRMTAVRCLGGQTQIGKVLRHTLKETEKKKVNALVFVGDCMEEDVDRLCHHAGRLGVLGTPAFMFQEGGEPIATRAFRQIARLTGGAYCNFDSSSARQLRELLGAVAVFAAGGRLALSDYGKRTGGAALQITKQIG
ncbi:MAG: VWA domain-containing protein [Defluviicoccus sp.]|nr:VWA domain-containing protein [Defluviicoccus sp.]